MKGFVNSIWIFLDTLWMGVRDLYHDLFYPINPGTYAKKEPIKNCGENWYSGKNCMGCYDCKTSALGYAVWARNEIERSNKNIKPSLFGMTAYRKTSTLTELKSNKLLELIQEEGKHPELQDKEKIKSLLREIGQLEHDIYERTGSQVNLTSSLSCMKQLEDIRKKEQGEN